MLNSETVLKKPALSWLTLAEEGCYWNEDVGAMLIFKNMCLSLISQLSEVCFKSCHWLTEIGLLPGWQLVVTKSKKPSVISRVEMEYKKIFIIAPHFLILASGMNFHYYCWLSFKLISHWGYLFSVWVLISIISFYYCCCCYCYYYYYYSVCWLFCQRGIWSFRSFAQQTFNGWGMPQWLK